MANDSFHQLLPTARYPGYRAFAGWQSQRQPPIVFPPASSFENAAGGAGLLYFKESVYKARSTCEGTLEE